MLGLGSLETALAFWLCIVATLICIIYGAINWNKEGTPDKVKSEKVVTPPGQQEKDQ